jgi:hypothetical protein
MPRARETTRAAPIAGAARSWARPAQASMAEGAPSHLRAGSSNPYGPWSWAVAKAKSANVHRHVSAVTVSLERGTEGKLRGTREVICGLRAVDATTERLYRRSVPPIQGTGDSISMLEASTALSANRVPPNSGIRHPAHRCRSARKVYGLVEHLRNPVGGPVSQLTFHGWAARSRPTRSDSPLHSSCPRATERPASDGGAEDQRAAKAMRR